MTPTPRAAAALAIVALTLLVLPVPVSLILAGALVAAFVVDAWFAHAPVDVRRSAPPSLARGVPATFALDADGARVRQPLPPDVMLVEGELVASRRGRHMLPPAVTRRFGPLGLAAWTRRALEEHELTVYPDLPAARRLASTVRAGRFRDDGLRRRGPLGLGTEFESVRDYSPDDDIRQINWRATIRLDRPMSNQYRVERDRDVVCVVDCGRLMAAPFAGLTRLDAALDAAVAVAAVSEVLGDRVGTIAFAREVLRSLPPRRAGARDVVQAVYDLEPQSVDSNYELAFQQVRGVKRALVVVFTDLLEESAAQPLRDALPVLARRHAVVVASAADPDIDKLVREPAGDASHLYRAAVAFDVLAARARVASQLRHAGADVVEAPPTTLAAACVRAYLRAKWTARF